jgi:hypothetical protein
VVFQAKDEGFGGRFEIVVILYIEGDKEENEK